MKNKNVKIESGMFSIEKLFLILSLLFGLILIFIIPPFQSPDEDTHFLKAYQISKGDFYPENRDGIIGYNIPKTLNDYITEKTNWMSDLNAKYSYSDEYYDQLLSYNYDEMIYRSISTQNTNVIADIVPALGVKIATFLHAFDKKGDVGPAVLLQFARFISLIVYTLLGFKAIKITPKFKKTFFTILMLPSVIFLRSIVTYDSLILVITVYSLAKMLKLYLDKDSYFKKIDILCFIICGYILLNVKTVYSIIFLLMFAIPKEKFGSLKNKIKYFSIMIGSVLLLTLLNEIPYLFQHSTSNLLIESQLKFVLNHPFQYFKIFVYNFLNQLHTQSFWMVSTFGLLDTYSPVLFTHIVYWNLFIIFIYDILHENVKFPIWINILYIVLIILSIFAVYASMYILWTPQMNKIIGGNEITGVQGRYFLPYLFIIPIIFSNKLTLKISNKLKSILKKVEPLFNYYYLIPICCTIITFFTIIIRYWV